MPPAQVPQVAPSPSSSHTPGPSAPDALPAPAQAAPSALPGLSVLLLLPAPSALPGLSVLLLLPASPSAFRSGEGASTHPPRPGFHVRPREARSVLGPLWADGCDPASERRSPRSCVSLPDSELGATPRAPGLSGQASHPSVLTARGNGQGSADAQREGTCSKWTACNARSMPQP